MCVLTVEFIFLKGVNNFQTADRGHGGGVVCQCSIIRSSQQQKKERNGISSSIETSQLCTVGRRTEERTEEGRGGHWALRRRPQFIRTARLPACPVFFVLSLTLADTLRDLVRVE